VLKSSAALRKPAGREVASTSLVPTAHRDRVLAHELVMQAGDDEQSGRLEAAQARLEAAIAAEPENAEAHYRLAKLLVATQPLRARGEYELSRKLDPVRYGE